MKSAPVPKHTPLGGRIIVYAADWRVPAGGIRKLYQHVDVLSGHGYPAFIAHNEPGFRCTWFENSTPIIHPPQSYPTRSDIMVVPEIFSWDLTAQTPGVPKVIFNQNAYQTFMWQTPQPDPNQAPCQRSDVLASIVVSQDSREYLCYAFPDHRVLRIRYSINPALFHFQSDKKRQIALMPRKAPADAAQVLGILESRNALDGFEIVRIENKREAETAAILRDSLIFLSFASEEGWSLPPMEAMACGCLVIGYHGRGAREYFTAERGFPIAKDDILGFASSVERVIGQFETNPQPLRVLSHRAADFISSHYSPQQEKQDILDVWEQIFSRMAPTAGR